MFSSLLSIIWDLQNVKTAALNQPDHLPVILLPAEDIRERSTSLTHPQKLSEQSATLKEVVKNNHRSIHQLDIVYVK